MTLLSPANRPLHGAEIVGLPQQVIQPISDQVSSPELLPFSLPNGALSAPLTFGAKNSESANHSTLYPGRDTAFGSDRERSNSTFSSEAARRKVSQPIFNIQHGSGNRTVPITPKMNTSTLIAPKPLRRASFANYDGTIFLKPSAASVASIRKSLGLEEKLVLLDAANQRLASSLSAYTPPLSSSPSFESASPVIQDDLTHKDPLVLLHWLTQVDLSRYGFMKEDDKQSNKKRKVSSAEYAKSFTVPSVEEFSRIESEFMDAVKRKRRVPSQSPDLFASSPSLPSTPRSRTPKEPSTPKTFNTTLSVPKSPATPRVPYKGKFGLHPTCGSCKTQKTPYWRDSWSDSFILCNACGLRYSKFKRYCVECSYVPRKEDKGAPCCTQCASPWSYKS